MLKPSHLASELNISEFRVRHHLRKLHPHHKPYTRWEWSENESKKSCTISVNTETIRQPAAKNKNKLEEERQRAREERQQARKTQNCKVIDCAIFILQH